MKFLTANGKGSPGSKAFQAAVESLYGIAYSIKMGLKFKKIGPLPKGYFDFKIPPLEGLWWQPGEFNISNKQPFEWQLMIMVPPFVSSKLFVSAKEVAKTKRPDVPYDGVRLEEFNEARVIQLTHIGPYDTESETIERLVNYARKYNLQFAGKHHEIYMSDPRRTKPENLKTVLRYPVGIN